MIKSALVIIRDAVMATVLFSLVGIVTNLLREDGIPLFADKEYEIYVPCPEPLGEVDPMQVEDDLIFDSRTILVDGRLDSEYDQWHIEGAESVPFDFLDPIPEDDLKELVRDFAASGKARVVVYGDGVDSHPREVVHKVLEALSACQLIVGIELVLSRSVDPGLPLAIINGTCGAHPEDTGYWLGKELSGRGLKNVFYIMGGAPALMEKYRR